MFGEEDILDIYTRENAMEDGTIFNLQSWQNCNREVDFTADLIEKLDKREIAKAIIKALEVARHFKQPDMKEIVVNGKKSWLKTMVAL